MDLRAGKDQAPRLLGAGTVAFGGLVLARPITLRLLCDVEDQRALRLLAGVVGVRDIVTGVALVTAPRGRPLRTVLLARVVLDAADGAMFGALACSPAKRRLARTAGLGFAAICAALLVSERDGGVS